MSVLNDASRQFESTVRSLRDRRRANDEQRDELRLTGQAEYEARLAAEQAKRDAERAALHDAHLGREEVRWAQIATLRNLRDEIATDRQRLTANLHAAVECGELEAALAAQQRLQLLDPIDAIAASRLSAHGIEVK